MINHQRWLPLHLGHRQSFVVCTHPIVRVRPLSCVQLYFFMARLYLASGSEQTLSCCFLLHTDEPYTGTQCRTLFPAQLHEKNGILFYSFCKLLSQNKIYIYIVRVRTKQMTVQMNKMPNKRINGGEKRMWKEPTERTKYCIYSWNRQYTENKIIFAFRRVCLRVQYFLRSCSQFTI